MSMICYKSKYFGASGVVCLHLKFSADGNVPTVSFIVNNSEHDAASKLKCTIYVSRCHKFSNDEDLFMIFLYIVKNE
jgi:hypothetical protein